MESRAEAGWPVETFPALSALPHIRAAFLTRVPGIDVQTDRESALARLSDSHCTLKNRAGFEGMPLVTAEQVHGCKVAAVTSSDHSNPFPIPGCDGLLTTMPGICLGSYVADCAAG